MPIPDYVRFCTHEYCYNIPAISCRDYFFGGIYMLESEGLKIMNMQRSAKIREDLCYIVQKEDFSQTAVDSVRLITQTETNMTDALNLKKKMRHIDSSLIRTDLFYSKQLFELKPIPETIVAVCNCSEDFKYFLEKVTEPCYNDFTCTRKLLF